MKFQVCCNNCKRAVNVKNLEINRIKQLNED
jgi:hypothetical protein